MPSPLIERVAFNAQVAQTVTTQGSTQQIGLPLTPDETTHADRESDLLRKVLPENVRQALLQAYQEADGEPSDDALTALLEGGRVFSTEERASLRVGAIAQSFAIRKHLLADTLSSTEVARILGTTRQTPLDRAHAGTLLALRDGGSWRFPAWQFDPAGPDGLVPGLVDALAALHTGPFAQARWLTLPHRELSEQTPLAALKAGHVAAVLPLAARVETM